MSFSSRIEMAVFEDLEDIVSLLESVEEPVDDIDPDFTRYFIVRSEKGTGIIGCIGLELFTGTALLRSFAVDSEHEGTELGTDLVKRVIEEAFNAGSETIYVCASKTPEFFWENEFSGIDLDDVPGEIRNSGLFRKDCPQVAAFVKKKVI